MMTLRRLAALASLLVLPVTTAGAQDAKEVKEASAGSLPAARTVIERYLDVTGHETLGKAKSVHVSGTISIPAMQLEGEYEVWQAPPDRFVMEAEFGGMGTQVQGFGNGIAWMVHPMMGAMVLEDVQELQARARSVFDAQAKPEKLYESVENVGREEFEGKQCYKLKLVLRAPEGMDREKTAKARTIVEYYEVESGLLRGSESTRESPQGTSEVKTITTDYEKFGGHLRATQTTQMQGGMEIRLTIDDVEYDAVEEGRFELPEEIAQMLAEKEY